MKTCTKLLALALWLPFSGACAPGEDPEGEGGPAADACEHAAEGPFVDVSAALEGADAPDVSAEHTAFRVSTADLMDEQGNRGGRVAYASGAAGDYYLFLSEHMDVTVTGSDGAELALEDSVHEVAECAELSMFHLVELSVGTYELELGPTSLEEITLVIVPGGAHAHEDEEG